MERLYQEPSGDTRRRKRDSDPIHGTGQWEIKASKGERVRLGYDVDLTFTKEMREGAQRGGQFFEDSLYIVNRALFVMSNAIGPRHVSFEVPSGFHIATPWHAETLSGFEVGDNSEFADNFTVIGTFRHSKLSRAIFTWIW